MTLVVSTASHVPGVMEQIDSHQTNNPKRKFSSLDAELNNQSSLQSTSQQVPHADKSFNLGQDFLQNLLTVLTRHDTRPSILDSPLNNATCTEDEPDSKRPKFSAEQISIRQKLTRGDYTELHQLRHDVDSVCYQTLSLINSKDTAELTADEIRLLAAVEVFKRVFQNMINTVIRHVSYRQGLLYEAVNTTEAKQKPFAGPSVKIEEENTYEMHGTSQSVLTCLAQTQGTAKQLFSSFQKPLSLEGIDVIVPLRESNLPNFVTLTKLPPALQNQQAKLYPSTFESKFSSRTTSTIPLPKAPNSRYLTKSSHPTFVSSETIIKENPNSKLCWGTTPLSSGSSIVYGDLPSKREDKKQREAAASTGAAQPSNQSDLIQSKHHTQSDTLFAKAFSSFAPCQDDSACVAPTMVRNQMWWHRLGQQRAERIYHESVSMHHDTQEQTSVNAEDEILDEILDIDPALVDLNLDKEKEDVDKEVDDMLEDIDNLIETLASYQAIRNSLAPTSASSSQVAPAVHKKSSNQIIGTPSNPSTSEVQTYQQLQTQLALLISRLPPSKMARVNGDKFKALRVSTNMIIKTDDTPGLLEDKHINPTIQMASGRCTPTPNTTYADIQSRTGMNSSALHTPAATTARLSNPQFPNTKTPVSQARPINMPAMYNNLNNGLVPPPIPVSRPVSQSGYYPGVSASPSHPLLGVANHYYHPQSHQQPQSQPQSQAQYQTPNQSQIQQASVANSKPPYTNGYVASPQTSNRYTPQATAAYNKITSGYGAKGSHYTNSNTVAGSSQNQRAIANNAITTTMPNQRPIYAQAPIASTASGPTGFHTTLTTQEQQMIMDRQRARAAQNHTQIGGNPNGTPPIVMPAAKAVQPNGVS